MIITILDQTRAIKLGCDGEEATCRSFDAKQPNEAKTEKLVEASDSDVAPQARKVVTTTIKKEAGQPTTNELNCVPNDLKLDRSPIAHEINVPRVRPPAVGESSSEQQIRQKTCSHPGNLTLLKISVRYPLLKHLSVNSLRAPPLCCEQANTAKHKTSHDESTTASSRDRSYWRDTRNDPPLKQARKDHQH